MKQSITKFLEFNGKNLIFLSVDGEYKIAIKPICEGVGVDYIQQFKNLKDDIMLGPKLCKHTILVPGNSQPRKYICLPEKYIYGYIFSIKSESEALIEYKEKCYELLFEFFHGTITSRKNLIKEKTLAEYEIEKIEKRLSENEDYKKMNKLKNTIATAKKQLNSLDKDIASEIQLNLFTGN